MVVRARRAAINACGNTVGKRQNNAAIAWIRHAASPQHFHPAIQAGIRARDFGRAAFPCAYAHSGVWRAAATSLDRCRASLTVAGAAQELSALDACASLFDAQNASNCF